MESGHHYTDGAQVCDCGQARTDRASKFAPAGWPGPIPTSVLCVPTLPNVERVQRAAVGPGDVIVLECAGPVSQDVAERLRAYMNHVWPDHRCLVMADGMKLKVLAARLEPVSIVLAWEHYTDNEGRDLAQVELAAARSAFFAGAHEMTNVLSAALAKIKFKAIAAAADRDDEQAAHFLADDLLEIFKDAEL